MPIANSVWSPITYRKKRNVKFIRRDIHAFVLNIFWIVHPRRLVRYSEAYV